jgi:hypothetical protein
MRPALEDAVPALTKRLCAGIGAADDPGDRDESFGSHRCRLIAGALVSAHERGMRTFDARRTAIAAAFEEAGLDLGSPYLSSRSRDLYWL